MMPKLKYRFRVLFENFGVSKPTTELSKQIVNAGRPNLTFDQVELHVYNSRVKYAGKHTWEDVSVVVRDDVTGAVSKLVGEQLQKQFDFLEMASAASGIDYKFLTKIEILDGGNGAATPVVRETWELYGCFLSEVNYGDMNYGTSEPATIAMTIKFDNAVQVNTAGDQVGVGQPITRTVNDVTTG